MSNEQLVINKVHESSNLAVSKGYEMPNIITVRFDLTNARIAANATYYEGKGIIRINPYFMNHFTEQFIKQTVPHEVCHVLAIYRHGKVGRGHGMYWRKYMKEVFRLFPYVENVYGVEKFWTVEEESS